AGSAGSSSVSVTSGPRSGADRRAAALDRAQDRAADLLPDQRGHRLLDHGGTLRLQLGRGQLRERMVYDDERQVRKEQPFRLDLVHLQKGARNDEHCRNAGLLELNTVVDAPGRARSAVAERNDRSLPLPVDLVKEARSRGGMR